MHRLGLALAGILVLAPPLTARANGPGSNLQPAPRGLASNIELAWDGGGSGGPSGAMGGHSTARAGQPWNGRAGFAPWGQNRQYNGRGYYRGAPAPTYWIWVPGSAVFDYPFADWRGPTGGWGNP